MTQRAPITFLSNHLHTCICRCAERHERKIGDIFARYGALVSRRPWLVIICSSLLCLLGVGLLRLQTTSKVEDVYTPMDSQAKKDREIVKNIFGDQTSSNFYPQSLVYSAVYGDVLFRGRGQQKLLNTTVIDELEKVYQQIQRFTVTSGKQYTYRDLCAQRNNVCIVGGDIVFTPDFRNRVQNKNVTWPEVEHSSIRSVFGGVQVSGGKLVSASVIRLRFYLRQDTDELRDLSQKWEEAFIDSMQHISTNFTELAYANSVSLDTELNKNIGGDIVFFSVTFTLMIVYATLVTTSWQCNCLTDRQNLGKAGVLAAGFAIVTSFGLISLAGVEFVDIVGVMPFLIIGTLLVLL